MPENYNISAGFLRSAHIHADRVFYSDRNLDVTYGEMGETVARLASFLCSGGRPRRVGILATRSFEAYAGILAAGLAGAAYVPLNLKWPEERIVVLLRSMELDALVVDANGADLYLYPGFMVMYSAKTSFALVGLDELRFDYHATRFIEAGTVPADSKIIDRTWDKVNKNGTPDKRFKGNYQIPIVKYGCFTMETATGMNEAYGCSNYESTELFGRAFTTYQALIRSLQRR